MMLKKVFVFRGEGILNSDNVKVRFAPSPTGPLHIGGARSALFNYLFAKHYNGDFILRIEDTDLERNVAGGEESQLYYLDWLGINPDESPIKPNPKYAPYRQMERLELYQKYAKQLIEMKYAYKCFCTPEELEADYQRQIDAGYVSTRYSRVCLNLSETKQKQLESEEKPFAIRIRVPDNETYEFKDIIRGIVRFESKDIGDWVLVKANGIPTYNYAVVIDDYAMEITHVFRGEEHLSNTPKQMMIYKMFNWEAPEFAHMTLIVNEQHKKLSKRDNTIMQFMSQYKEAGYLPAAMFNFMALLGWSPEGEQEIFSKEEFIRIFDEKRLSKSPSMFDKNKLTWVNNRYIKNLPLEDVVQLTKPFLEKAYNLSDITEEWLYSLVGLYQEQLSYGAEIVPLTKLFFEAFTITSDAKEIAELETTPIVKTAFKNKITEISEWTMEAIKEAINATKEETNIKGKPLFMGLRVVCTGDTNGPDLVSSIYLLGQDKIITRLSK